MEVIYIAFCAACLIAAGLFTALFRCVAIIADETDSRLDALESAVIKVDVAYESDESGRGTWIGRDINTDLCVFWVKPDFKKESRIFTSDSMYVFLPRSMFQSVKPGECVPASSLVGVES